MIDILFILLSLILTLLSIIAFDKSVSNFTSFTDRVYKRLKIGAIAVNICFLLAIIMVVIIANISDRFRRMDSLAWVLLGVEFVLYIVYITVVNLIAYKIHVQLVKNCILDTLRNYPLLYDKHRIVEITAKEYRHDITFKEVKRGIEKLIKNNNDLLVERLKNS